MTYINPHGQSCPWFHVTEAWGAPNIKWCEETLCQWISEPANTWSNLGYLIVGLYIWYIGKKHSHQKNLLQFGPIVFFMGAMSFFYHQSNFYVSQIFDFIGMFFFVGWALGMNLIRLGMLSDKKLFHFNSALAASLILATHLMYIAHLKFQVIILISAFLIIATEMKVQKTKRSSLFWFKTTIVILIFAFGFSIIDGQRIWCDSTAHGWFSQGHALWHWTAAVAMGTIYRHYLIIGKKT